MRFGIVLLAAMATMFTACEKEVKNTDMQLDTSKTATIVFKLGANTDLKQIADDSDHLWLSVPAGASVILSCPNAQLVHSTAGTVPGVHIQQHPLSGKEVKVEVPVRDEGTVYSAVFNDCVASQTAADGTTVTNMIFKGDFASANPLSTGGMIYPGQVVVVTVKYTGSVPADVK